MEICIDCGEEFDAQRQSRMKAKKNRCYICDNLLKRYGLNRKNVEDMLKDQGDCCFICDTPLILPLPVKKDNKPGFKSKYDKDAKDSVVTSSLQPMVDHDHDTGVIRGILCKNCNTMVGSNNEDMLKILAKFTNLQLYWDLHYGT